MSRLAQLLLLRLTYPSSFAYNFSSVQIGLSIHLFVNVARPGDREDTFLIFRVKLSPVTTGLTTQR